MAPRCCCLTAAFCGFMLFLSACSVGQAPSANDPASKAVNTVPDYESELAMLQPVTVFLFRPEEMSYHPVSTVVEGAANIEKLANLVTGTLGLPALLYHLEQSGSQIILSMQGEYIDSLQEDEIILLNTLCATLCGNLSEVEEVVFSRDGGPYYSENLYLVQGEAYQWPTLRIGGGTLEELAEIRRQIPYPGLGGQAVMYLEYDIVSLDDTGKALTLFLARVGDPGVDVAVPQELSSQFVLRQALKNAPWYTTGPYYEEREEIYLEELLPIAVSVGRDILALTEHVEKVTEELFGQVDYVPEDMPPCSWHPQEGVYSQPLSGMSYGSQPVIFAYEEIGDQYRIEVAYLEEGHGVYFESDGTMIATDDVIEAAEQSRRREVVVEKMDDGTLRFCSHRFL